MTIWPFFEQGGDFSTYMHAWMRTCIHTYIRLYILHTFMHAYIHACSPGLGVIGPWGFRVWHLVSGV